MMRIEDMDAEQVDNYIAYLKQSKNPIHSLDLVSVMFIAEGMRELEVDTVAELLSRIPKSH